jgi:3-phenylpropionate/trans-cinnamate dioxygenase ferredoxin subunit
MSTVATDFVAVAHLDDLEAGEALAVEIADVEIALVRDEDGGVHALADVCSHDEIALSDGDVEGCTIECWKHGSHFDLETGRPLQLPAVLPVPVYPVQILEDGTIAVNANAPSLAARN